ncbi:uncharacterized protein LOC126746447 isoform X2 [Anthonomus grandis grandis]|uniref:uncharacterized protein LOC126746447 isoform X2 n=1 Tax=Anthonomus grandis grandis TaxID=2921223 RepID=UPI0021668D24|nr:uncharacterized protein LOC126746447 isoform X2 [Anthonomus grandis grandis]
MTSRRKGKKGNKSKSTGDQFNRATKYNPYAYFSADDLSKLKVALKIKEASIPIAIGCVILNRFDILQKAVSNGLNINQLGPNSTTALIWAVRYKYLNIIEYLLDHGADPNIKIENNENLIIIALEHKLWEENTFIEFWDRVLKVSEIDVNATNKNGHTILHIAVRRQWEKFIEKLLEKKVNLDITNINGVTPLMTACFRNNLNIVNTLINSGADFTKEDNHYRTALCYAIITGAKLGKPPFPIAERIIFELQKDLSFRDFIKRRMEVVDIILKKDKVSDQETEMLRTLAQYIVQHTENGLKIILDFCVFDLMADISLQALRSKNIEKQKLLLQLLQELLYYNDQVVGFKSDIQAKLSDQLLRCNVIKSCLKIVKNEGVHFKLAFQAVILFCTMNEMGLEWAKNQYAEFGQVFRNLPEGCTCQKDCADEKRQKLMKKKVKKVRRFLNVIQGTGGEPSKEPVEDKSEFNVKKSKRRSKVLKAKLTKIKNMELAERLKNTDDSKTKKEDVQIVKETEDSESNCATIINEEKKDVKEDDVQEAVESPTEDVKEAPADTEDAQTIFEQQLSKDIKENEQLVNSIMTDELFCPFYTGPEFSESRNPITSSLKHFLKTQEEQNQVKEEVPYVPTFPEWKSKIFKLPFNDWSVFGDKMKTDKRKLKAAIQYMKKISLNFDNTANAVTLEAALKEVVEYLKELLEIIVTRTKNNWELIGKSGKHGKKAALSEKQAITDLQANFSHLLSSICSLAHSNLPEAIKNIYQLESTLLKFPVNGKTLMSDACAVENVKVQYTTYSNVSEESFLSYVENVLNGFGENREDIKISVMDGLPTVMESEPPGLYLYEMSLLSPAKPPNKRKALEVKLKTMQGAYHLIPSIEKLLDEDVKAPIRKSEGTKRNEPERKYSEMVLKILSKPSGKEVLPDSQKSRWSDKIEHLLDMKQRQMLQGGEVLVSRYPERSHVISQGGNFNLVTLGLSASERPLAVKKIPSKHSVCKTLKSLINPLLVSERSNDVNAGVRNKHILNYFACDYEENKLIVATPLCEYNIGQYVLLLKENAEKVVFEHLTQMEIIKQFLNGLAFLHQQPVPIIHGNLKPSNIFIDIHGVVRLAEFGINKALFKLIEAPKSSLIWFSQETYRVYRLTSAMECSICSDIQVAGMLIYFIISGGIHPFGVDVGTILKNLETSNAIQLKVNLDVTDETFIDLATWMLMYEPADRPHIKNVLGHVLFWSNDRKWRFILNCSGVSTNGVPLGIATETLYGAISETSRKEHIQGQWVDFARRKFPKMSFQGEDTVVGFLKFIKEFYESQVRADEESILDLKSCVLTYFPAFPLTLYRILEGTGIIKEYPFMTYTMTETVVT